MEKSLGSGVEKFWDLDGKIVGFGGGLGELGGKLGDWVENV